MTDEELNEIEARANAASPGPWEPDFSTASGNWYVLGPLKRNELPVLDGYPMLASSPALRGYEKANFSLMAHAREDIPGLIAEIRRLKHERTSS